MSEPGAPATGGKTALVVEDNAPIRKIICHHLQNAGYKVLEAGDGIEALNLVLANPVHIILCDIMMPNLDGAGFVQKLRTETPHTTVPVIMCSAKGHQEDVVQLIRLGANDYIVKPFTKDTLLRKVKKALGEPMA